MSKRTVILLIAALALVIVFAGQAEAKAVVKQNPTSVNVAAPLSMSNSLYSGTSDSNPFARVPDIPDIIISDLLADCAQQPCWIRSAQYQRQIHGFARTGYGVKLATSRGCELAQQGGQPKLAILESLSGSLSSLSPPGLILRL